MKQFLFLAFLLFSFLSSGQEDHYFYPFKDAEGWGVKRANGQELFSERYDSIFVSSANYKSPYKNKIQVRKGDKWGVVDSFGVDLIPIQYSSIFHDEFGYEIGTNTDYLNGTKGFLSLYGDTLVPFEHALFSTRSVGINDFLILALKSHEEEKYAIYSSDGVRRTDYEFDEVIGIDSTRFFSVQENMIQNYFALHSLKTNKYGVYDAINKRIVVPPIYDYVCSGWCELNENPLLHPGPVAYTGTTPVFHMQTGDEMRLINIHGDIIFSSKNVPAWDEKKKYYVNEQGLAREVIGKPTYNSSGNVSPPFVLKDATGYFFVDSVGTALLNDQRVPSIEKFNHSYDKRKEANWFIVTDDTRKQSLLDYSLKEQIPPNYESIAFLGEYIACRRADNSYDFYDSLFVLLDFDPREENDDVKHKQNYFFTEIVEIPSKIVFYGIKSKDNEVLIPPKYYRSEFVGEYKTRSDSSFYILSNETSVDIFNDRLEQLMHFEADDYSFYEPWSAGGRSLLRVAKQNKFSLYDLSAKEWIIQDKPCISIDSIRLHRERRDGLIITPRIEWHKNEPYLWVYDQQSGWNLYDMEGKVHLKWKRHSRVPPKIVYRDREFTFAIQRVESQEETVCYLANQDGSEWVENRRVINYHFVPELDRVFLGLAGKGDLWVVLDNQLNALDEITGMIRTYSGRNMYIHLDRQDSICKYVNEGGEAVIERATWINSRGKGIYTIYSKKGTFLITQFSNGFMKRYSREPNDFTNGIIGCKLEDSFESWKYDFYNYSGELLFENYNYRGYYRSRGPGGYIIIDNEEEELWLTHDGTVFHRNKLE